MNIAICDDNVVDAGHLVSMLKGMHTHQLFSSAEELLLDLEASNKHFDLYLLDIFMGEINGVQLGKQIRQLDDHALICYVSSSPDYYAEAFSLYAFQYLLKPVTEEAFQELLRRASEQFVRNNGQSLHLQYKGRAVSIPYSKILYISSMGHTLYVHCKDGHIERQIGRLNDLMTLLDSSVFARCHQSYIVNLYNVSSLESDFFLCAGEQVPISRRYFPVKDRYRSLLFSDSD